MPSIYDTVEDIKAIENMLEEITTGEDGLPRESTEDEKANLMAILNNLQGAYEEKAERILKLRANLIAFADGCKAEEERISKRRKTAENKVKSLVWLLEDSMRRLGSKKIITGTFTMSVQKNPPSVYVINAGILPPGFWRVIPEHKEPDKRLILETLKSGRDVPGATLFQSEGLRVR
jgi:hypothetical protein